MSLPDASKTPEHAPAAAATNPARRSFTLPARIAPKPPRPAQPANTSDGIETLFVCTSTKIVSFTTSSQGRRTSPSRRSSSNAPDSSRSIPWRSPTERTMAVGESGDLNRPDAHANRFAGVLRIYRVTSSNVSFLNSGNLLHTIFPRSQCWCVDGESIFVLRVRQDSYYRMELPHESAEDKEKVDQLKIVLDQVLQFEKTQCPFTREFEVELPERPKSPPRRKSTVRAPGKAKKWLFDKKWMPEDHSRPSTPSTPSLEATDSGTASSYEDDDRSSINTERSETIAEVTTEPSERLPGTVLAKAPHTSSVTERAKAFQMRSVTAPTSLDSDRPSLVKELPQINERDGPEEPPRLNRMGSLDAQSVMSSVDSFYSAGPSTRSPSPPYVDAEGDPINPWANMQSLPELDLETRGRSKHRRQTSEMTVRASSLGDVRKDIPVTPTLVETPSIDIHPSSAPSTPPLVSDSDDDSVGPPSLDVPTPPANIRMRRLTGASQRRAFSPMPQPQNLFRPPTTSAGKQFTAALIRKTVEVVLGPPAHLVQLMLRIAASVSDGVFGFNTYRVRHPSENKIPCSWESSDEEDWPEEDDFGIPLRTFDDSTTVRRTGFSKDID
ncbi:hypothetical protein DM02DRAFT_327809 [Periconia macrospinosa]|uniref:Inheritance of peroxisomes protein 1 n=1 Tax=Periconia macrospinosa TaxID=97972 RepID=A0A2V1EAC8_9PLEO|nr:hypothetical protein DM02DRAFT_327809 [Periconia macrospinosa]